MLDFLWDFINKIDIKSLAIFLGIGLFLILFFWDLFAYRGNKNPSKKLTTAIAGASVLSAIAFGFWIHIYMGPYDASAYFTVYFLEKTLAFDNLIVIALVFKYLEIPKRKQSNVLLYGLLGAGLFRMLFLLAGTTLVSQFSWLLILAGFFLIIMGGFAIKKIFVSNKKEKEAKMPIYTRWFMNMPFIDKNTIGFLGFKNGKLVLQRLGIALILIEFADIIFALDSVPAALAVTQDLFLVYTSNMFALLGLRSLFLLVNDKLYLLDKMQFFVGLLLIFIGGKLLLEKLLGIGTEPLISLSITLFLLLSGLVYSIFSSDKGSA